MTGFEPRYELSMRATLSEFAAYDAGLFFGAFLRRAPLFVHSDTGALVYRPHLQRSLALKMLASSGLISERFMWRRLAELRSTEPVMHGVLSANVLHLGRRAQTCCRVETAGLARLIRREDSSFDIKGTALDPMHYAHDLEKALLDLTRFTPLEMDIIFRSWADLFAHVLRSTYLKYGEVLAGWPDVMLQTHQDFVDTWPMTLAAAPEAPQPLEEPLESKDDTKPTR